MACSANLVFVCISQGEELPSFRFADNKLSLVSYNYQGHISSIQTAYLLFQDEDGYPAGTNEIYLFTFLNGVYSKIEDQIYGHTATLKVADLNSDETLELLVFYSAGGHQYILKLYHILDSELRPVEDGHVASNMHSIEIEDNEIHVNHHQGISANEAIIKTSRYRMIGDTLQHLDTSSETVSD